MSITRMTAAAKFAVAEEIVRMTDRPVTDVAKLAALKSDRLLDEFEEVQSYWVTVPMSEWFKGNRPVWKIDPQELWDNEAAYTQHVRSSRIV